MGLVQNKAFSKLKTALITAIIAPIDFF